MPVAFASPPDVPATRGMPVFQTKSEVFKDKATRDTVENWLMSRANTEERARFIRSVKSLGLDELAMANQKSYQQEQEARNKKLSSVSESKKPPKPPSPKQLPHGMPNALPKGRSGSATFHRALSRANSRHFTDDVQIATYDTMLGFPPRGKSATARGARPASVASGESRVSQAKPQHRTTSARTASSHAQERGPFGQKPLISRNKLVESRRRLSGVGSARFGPGVEVSEPLKPVELDQDVVAAQKEAQRLADAEREEAEARAKIEAEKTAAEKAKQDEAYYDWTDDLDAYQQLQKFGYKPTIEGELTDEALAEIDYSKSHAERYDVLSKISHSKVENTKSDGVVESAYFVQETEYSGDIRKALGMEGCVTTHQSQFGLAEVDPHLFHKSSMTGRGIPEPNQNWKSEWYEQFRVKPEHMTDAIRAMEARRFLSHKQTVDQELHGAPHKQIEGGGESMFYKRLRQGKQYFGDIFSDSAKGKIEDYLKSVESTGGDVDKTNERREFLQTLRNLHVTVQNNQRQTTYHHDYTNTGNLAKHLAQEESDMAHSNKDLIEGRVMDKKKMERSIAATREKRRKELEEKRAREQAEKDKQKPKTYEEYAAMFDRDGDGNDDFDLDGDGKRDVMVDEDDDGIDDFDPTFTIDPDNPPPIVAIPTWSENKVEPSKGRDRNERSSIQLQQPGGLLEKPSSTYQNSHGSNFYTICEELRKTAKERAILEENDVDGVYLCTPGFGAVNMNLPDAPKLHSGYPVPRSFVYKKTKLRKAQTATRNNYGPTDPKIMNRHITAAHNANKAVKLARDKSNVPLGKHGLQYNPGGYSTTTNEYGYYPGKPNVFRIV